jgi:predicted O-methyltransferase YrrM
MEHFYQNIEGWFSYEYIYKDMIDQAEGENLFVEIGSYKGKSAAFMAVEIINSGKNIKFECIDPMILMGDYLNMPENEKMGYSAEEFHNRLLPVKDYYKLHQMTSVDASKLYADNSIDFIMIDGDHSYEGVYNDITNFLPKMRSGGLMTGDDAYSPQIIKAVQDAAKGLEVVSNGIHFFISIP